MMSLADSADMWFILPIHGLNVLAGMALFGVIFYLLVPVDTWSGIFDWWMIGQLTFTRIACVFVGIPVGVLIMFLAVPSHT